MARDASLLRLAELGASVVRVYSWDEPWVSLGRFQRASDALLPSCRAPWVSRPTGGRAVLHGHDLTIALAAPLVAFGLENQRGLRAVYRAAIQPVLLVLRECGVSVALGEALKASRAHGDRSADCFLAVSANDVVDERTGAKVCGCAMRVTDRAVLVQGSLPVRVPLVDPCQVYAQPATVCPTMLGQEQLAEAFRHVLLA